MGPPEIPGFYFDSTRNRYFKIDSKPADVPAAQKYSHQTVTHTKRVKKEKRQAEKQAKILKNQFIKRPNFLSQTAFDHRPLKYSDPLLWRELGQPRSPSSDVGPDQTLEVFISGFTKAFHCVYELQNNDARVMLQIYWFDMTDTHLLMGYRLLPDPDLRLYITKPDFPAPESLLAREIVAGTGFGSTRSFSDTDNNSSNRKAFEKDEEISQSPSVYAVRRWLDLAAANTPATWKAVSLFRNEPAVIAITNEPDFLPGVSGREMIFSVGGVPAFEHPWSVAPIPDVTVHSYQTESFPGASSVCVQTYTWSERRGSWGTIGKLVPNPSSTPSPPLFRYFLRFRCDFELTSSCVLNPTTFAFGSRNGFVMVLHIDKLPKVKVQTWYHGSRPVQMSRVGNEGKHLLVVGAGNSKPYPFTSTRSSLVVLYDLRSIKVEEELEIADVPDFSLGEAAFWWHPAFKQFMAPIQTIARTDRPAGTLQYPNFGSMVAVELERQSESGQVSNSEDSTSRTKTRARIRACQDKHDRSFLNTGVLSFSGFSNENEGTLGFAVYHGNDSSRIDSYGGEGVQSHNTSDEGNKGFELFALADDKGAVLIYSLLTGQLLKKIEDDHAGDPAHETQPTGSTNLSSSFSPSSSSSTSDNVVRTIRFQSDDRGCPRLVFTRRNNMYVYQWDGNRDYRFCHNVPFSENVAT